MEAFSDGILAIVITIMVLKLNMPKDTSIEALREVFPIFLAYVLSYVYVGIYWVNHHHLITAVNKVSGRLLWKNLFWIFWLSLIPMATEWMGLHPFQKLPSLLYGSILFMCSISYIMLQSEVIKINGEDSKISESIGKDRKGKASILMYALSVGFALIFPSISYIMYILVAVMWVVPDTRLEEIIKD